MSLCPCVPSAFMRVRGRAWFYPIMGSLMRDRANLCLKGPLLPKQQPGHPSNPHSLIDRPYDIRDQNKMHTQLTSSPALTLPSTRPSPRSTSTLTNANHVHHHIRYSLSTMARQRGAPPTAHCCCCCCCSHTRALRCCGGSSVGHARCAPAAHTGSPWLLAGVAAGASVYTSRTRRASTRYVSFCVSSGRICAAGRRVVRARHVFSHKPGGHASYASASARCFPHFNTAPGIAARRAWGTAARMSSHRGQQGIGEQKLFRESFTE